MKKKQNITIAALIISIIGLSIGFAAFSNNLTISGGATVNPDASALKVVFAKNTNTSSLDTSDVVAYSVSTDANATDGVINNDAQDGPTLTNLSASFTRPGQSVVYKLYVVNAGKIKAYLSNLTFGNKSCAAVETGDSTRATDSLVSAACNGISASVKIGDLQPMTSSGSLNNLALDVNDYKEITVTLSYAEGSAYVDGPMTVTFGNIEINATTTGNEMAGGETGEEDICVTTVDKSFGSTCTLSSDNDSSGTITLGDKITCGTESFYVIETPTSGTVKMLAEWNLNVTDPDADTFRGISVSQAYPCSTVGYQDEHVRGWVDDDNPNNLAYMKQVIYYRSGSGSGSGSGGSGSYYGSGSGSGSGGGTRAYYLPYGTVAFWSETAMDSYNHWYGYWTNNSSDSLNSNFSACTGTNCYDWNGIQYPLNVYGISNSDNGATATLTSHVTKYVNALNTALSTNASGRLITYDELSSLGCTLDKNSESYITCPNSLNWLYNTSYWSGTASTASSIIGVYTSFNDDYLFDLETTSHFGVRPVIEISSSVIQAS